MSCFIIAEAGVNHNGRLDLALQLIDAAAQAGADAVKFQTFRTDDVIVPGTAKAEYQQQQTGAGDQYDMIRALELSEADHHALAARCRERGIEFMSTPFDRWATDLLIGLGMCRIKIASGELTHRRLIEDVAARGLPLILSTGMASLEEVKRTVEWINAARQQANCSGSLSDHLTVLHCTSNYPAEAAEVNLRAMSTLAQTLGLAVGYSDHTLGIEVSLAAVALGAQVIEKHFTLDRNLPGPDHQASLSVQQLTDLVAGVRKVEACLGDGTKAPRATEIPVRDLVRRSAFATRDLSPGTVVTHGDIRYLRPGTGIGAEHVNEVVGRRLVRAVQSGHMLEWNDLA